MEEPQLNNNTDKICTLLVPFFHSASFPTTKRTSRFIGDALVGNRSVIFPTAISASELKVLIGLSGCNEEVVEDSVVYTKNTETTSHTLTLPNNRFLAVNIEFPKGYGGQTLISGILANARAAKKTATYALTSKISNRIGSSSSTAVGDTIAIFRDAKVWDLTGEDDLNHYEILSDYYATHQM